MNIGIVTTWFASGGGMVSKAYETTLKVDNNVFIFARGGAKQINNEWDSPNVFWASKQPNSTGIKISEFKRWIKDNSITMVLFNEQRHWEVIIEAKKMGLIIGAYVDYYTADTIPFFSLYDFLICNTKRHLSAFSWHKQALYCPWGTDVEMFKPMAQDERPLTFIISSGWDGAYAKGASWMDRRGAGMALRSFTKVKGDCKFIVLSQVPISDCPDEWSKIVKADSRIDFRFGSFSPTPYSLGDVYVYPSRLDGIGLTLPEALSSGLPAITTNCPPMNEFVTNDMNGTLVDVDRFCGRPDGYYWAESLCNEISLQKAFEKYLNNPELAKSEGNNARLNALKELSWEKNSSILNDFLKKVEPLNQMDQNEINGVNIKAVNRYDRNNNPTPIQRIIIGAYRLYINLFERG
jgi:1,2-diacylglycerol 3-alpha-glucosyltransferase